MARKRMLWRLFASYILLVVLTLTAVYLYSTHSFSKFYLSHMQDDLETRGRLILPLLREPIDSGAVDIVDSICVAFGENSNTRITVVLADGTVLGDTREDPRIMERHDMRPEIAVALEGEIGMSTRFSSTVGQKLMYVAIPVYNGHAITAVVRAAVPITELQDETGSLTRNLLFAGVIIALLAVGISLWMSRTITRPLEELRRGAEEFAAGDLSYTLPVSGYEEVQSLAQTMNQMASQLHDRLWSAVRQRNEQEAILAAMVEGVMAVDSSERIIKLNRAAARLFRVKTDEVSGRSVHEVVRNSDLHRLVAETLASEAPVEGSIELTSPRGRQLQVHGTTLHDESGRAIGAVIVLNDITQLRRLENVRREFVANVSHELRTPITSIKGFLETLLEGAVEKPDDARRFLTIMARHTDRLNAIIEDLLMLSRIEQGSEEGGIELSRNQVGSVLRSAAQSVETRAAEKHISIDFDGELDVAADINPRLLEQALVNLLDNAITYSPEDGKITFGARPFNGGVEIYVRDRGPGIEAGHLERIFERFYRVEKSRSRDQGGTGLGLAIVKHIALAHEGSVYVDSTVGQGSEFVIQLPHRYIEQ